jgi:hypothetical protein
LWSSESAREQVECSGYRQDRKDAIYPIALNRKKALFAGSDAGAKHRATIASLIE